MQPKQHNKVDPNNNCGGRLHPDRDVRESNNKPTKIEQKKTTDSFHSAARHRTQSSNMVSSVPSLPVVQPAPKCSRSFSCETQASCWSCVCQCEFCTKNPAFLPFEWAADDGRGWLCPTVVLLTRYPLYDGCCERKTDFPHGALKWEGKTDGYCKRLWLSYAAAWW